MMDTSETYIKMRLKAISDLGVGKPPDLVPNIEVCWLTTFVFVDFKGDVYYLSIDETCQLERQDQLQEMIGDFNETDSWLHGYYRARSDSDTFMGEGAYWHDFTSMEQLWLAFVMKDNNKIWHREDWIKEVDYDKE